MKKNSPLVPRIGAPRMRALMLGLLILVFLSAACRIGNEAVSDSSSNPGKSGATQPQTDATQQAATPGAPPSVSGDVPQPQDEANLPAPQIVPPADWYITEVSLDTLQATLYTDQNAEQLGQDPSQTGVPPEFAAGALVLSALPAGSDPQALQQGLAENLANYGVHDFESMLFVVDQIGLINLSAVESVEFVSAQIDMLFGREALRMEGNVQFDAANRLHVQIWLTWTESNFVALYEMANENYWAVALPIFSQMR